MAPRRWLPLRVAVLAAALLLGAGLPVHAQESGQGSVSGLIEAIRSRMTSLHDSFEEWRRAPYERIEQDVATKQAELRQQIATLQEQLDALRGQLATIQLTPGPPGPSGNPGPPGPRGAQGLPGNLQLAGETCPDGQSVTGFDAFGNVLCGQAKGANTAGVGVDCPGTLVSAADLRRCDLRRQNLVGRDLSFATLVKADLRTPMQGTDLQGADLRRAEMTGNDLSNVNLSYANLTFAKLGSVRIDGGDLSGAVLRKAELSLSRISGAKMIGADLSDATMILSQNYGVDYTRANLSGVDLRQSLFQDSSLFLATTSTSLEQARMINTICPDGVNSNQNGNSCVGHELH